MPQESVTDRTRLDTPDGCSQRTPGESHEKQTHGLENQVRQTGTAQKKRKRNDPEGRTKPGEWLCSKNDSRVSQEVRAPKGGLEDGGPTEEQCLETETPREAVRQLQQSGRDLAAED